MQLHQARRSKNSLKIDEDWVVLGRVVLLEFNLLTVSLFTTIVCYMLSTLH